MSTRFCPCPRFCKLVGIVQVQFVQSVHCFLSGRARVWFAVAIASVSAIWLLCCLSRWTCNLDSGRHTALDFTVSHVRYPADILPICVGGLCSGIRTEFPIFPSRFSLNVEVLYTAQNCQQSPPWTRSQQIDQPAGIQESGVWYPRSKSTQQSQIIVAPGCKLVSWCKVLARLPGQGQPSVI